MTCVSIESAEMEPYTGTGKIVPPISQRPGKPVCISKPSVTIPFIEPFRLKQEFPLSGQADSTVQSARSTICQILKKEDKRMLVITGPCSIHEEGAALEYAHRLRILQEEVRDSMFLVMRTYVEKPRTSIGWKGLVNDPRMDGSCDMTEGLRRARNLLVRISEMGVPCATEMLEPLTPAYIEDAVAWAVIGARTTESQIHREMASGLSMPVGFKNSTDGSLTPALNAIMAAAKSHHFPGINWMGQSCIVGTPGNPWGHLILRGGKKTNYDPASIQNACNVLLDRGLNPAITVDCSHGNSGKDFRMQKTAWDYVIHQRTSGNENIVGLMLESHLHEGRQNICSDLSLLQYGVSVTDACISWEETERLILSAHGRLKENMTNANEESASDKI
ncbi:MAG: 3-deoxy-7-phosphoheptulonate synthase [Desulfobacterales bacterium]